MRIFTNNINIISLIIIFLSACFGYGYLHPDEHHQILEFANSKIIDIDFPLPWEYYVEMRPSLQPWIAFIIINLFHFIGIEDPFFIAFVIRLLGGLAFWIVILKTAPFWVDKYFKHQLTDNQFKAITFLFWIVPFIATRFSSENLSGILLVLGLFFFLKGENKKDYFLAGFILASSFFFRFQIGIIIFTILIHSLFFKRKIFQVYFLLFLGSLPVIFINIYLDFLFYEKWTISAINYFTQNIINDAASNFGISPWYAYFSAFIEKIYPPFSIFLLFLFFTGLVRLRRDLMVWVSVAFIIVHSIVPHKEPRFLFPIIFPFIIITTNGFFYYYKLWGVKKWFEVILKISIIANLVFLFFRTFTSASDDVIFSEMIYNNLAKADDNIITLADKNEYSTQIGFPKTFYMSESHLTTNATSWNITDLAELNDLFKEKKITKSLLIIKNQGFNFPSNIKEVFEIKKIESLLYSFNIGQQIVNPGRFRKNFSLYLVEKKE